MPACFLALAIFGCASQGTPPATYVAESAGDTPSAVFRSVMGITLGEPLAISVDFVGRPLVADGVAARIIRFSPEGDKALEFQSPSQIPGFYPGDVKATGFFVYSLDVVSRLVVRFDHTGTYRDVLIDFDELFEGGRIAPSGMDVDNSGRIVVTDETDHQVILFDAYLKVEIVFGSYGSFPGQFDSPAGISFLERGGLLVTDSGNRRLQIFDEGGKFLRVIPEEGMENPMRRPRRAVMASDGTIYVADPGAGHVFVFDASGRLLRSIRPAGVNNFRPTDVEITSTGQIYVTDTANSSLYVFR